jgi:hypothetical protein
MEKELLWSSRQDNAHDLDSDCNQSRDYSQDPEHDCTTILTFDSEYNDNLKVVTFLDLICLSHFESSLARAVRQSGEARNAANRFDR